MDSMRVNSDDEDDEYFEEEEEYTEKPQKRLPSLIRKRDEEEDTEEDSKPRLFSRKVAPVKKSGSLEVALVKPSVFDDAKTIVDDLLYGKAVVLNMEGINTECAGDMTSETATFTTGEQSPQTIALSAGTNWVSFNVETNLDALKAALVATGNTAITIQGQSLNATYNPNNGRWTGQLRVLDLSQMYKIKVADACEITLEGTPVDPSMYPVTIAPGVNYIAYPFNTNMTVTDAFAGFGVNGDVVQSQLQNANFNGSRWIGQLRNLEPGKGYVYKSASTETRVFNYPTSR